jgi:hypothetical protein
MLAVTNNMNKSTAGRRGEELKSKENEDSTSVRILTFQEVHAWSNNCERDVLAS